MAEPKDPLHDEGYPALHNAADAASQLGQKHFLWALRVRLVGLLIAAAGGAFASATSPVAGGWVAVVGFAFALTAELYSAQARPERTWYEGRAAAESAKTLAWRYAVGGESFECSLNGQLADRTYTERIKEVLFDLDEVRLTSSGDSAEQITSTMRAMRAASFLDRRANYRNGRIEEQRAWYETKAQENERKAHLWTVTLYSAEGLGLLGGVLTVAGVVDVDLLGLWAAVAAAATAWLQAKQHGTLATAYGVTAQELAAVKSELDALTSEGDWGAFVGQAEEAISREHTLWRASRGVRARPSRSGGRS